MIPPEISNPDTAPAQLFESTTQPASDYNAGTSPLGSVTLDNSSDDRPAEDTPAPAGLVQSYLDHIQKQVHAQIEGCHKKPDCYRQGTFWIRPVDNWFALQGDTDSPEKLYYSPVFVWVPSVLMPSDFQFTCVFCGEDKMGESGACYSI